MTLRAVPARYSATARTRSLVGAVAGKAATTTRVAGTALQACQQPQLLSNVVLAGHPCDEEDLHRPSARTAATVAGLSFSAIGTTSMAEATQWRSDGGGAGMISRSGGSDYNTGGGRFVGG